MADNRRRAETRVAASVYARDVLMSFMGARRFGRLRSAAVHPGARPAPPRQQRKPLAEVIVASLDQLKSLLGSGLGFQPAEECDRRAASIALVGTRFVREERAVAADLEHVSFGRTAAPHENIRIVVARDFKHDVIRRRSLLRQLRTVKINGVLIRNRFRINPDADRDVRCGASSRDLHNQRVI
jgi:hypothetical protein